MPTRFLLIFVTFLLAVLLYVDRACISVAKEEVTGELELSDTQWGWVMSAFALGYALLQTPSGVLADRFGPRRVLAGVVVFWSVFTGLTGLVWQYWTLLVVRFCFGAGEAGAFPGCARAVYAWLPVSERGLAQGVNFSGGRLGAAFAMPGVAWMIERLGWRTSFLVLGAVGFVWAAAWYWWFRDDPAEHAGLSPGEREHILAKRQQAIAGPPAGTKLTTAAVVRSGNMWLIMGQYFASNFTFFFCLTWLPPYLKRTYELDSVQAGFYAMWPLLAGVVGNWTAGAVVDALYRRGRWHGSRRLPAIAGFVLAAAGVAALPLMTDVAAAVVCLTLAVFGADMTLSPSWSVCIDIGGRSAGAVSGTMNMAGNLGSFVTALAFPYLTAWTGSEAPFFFVGAALNLLAVAAWLGIRPDRPLEGC
jgi:ACS family glucarate transporter-like MFS transporter